MDFAKLRSIAFMAQQGATPNERQVARRILAKHGYTPEQLLMPTRNLDQNRCEDTAHDIDNAPDIIELSDAYLDDMVEKINSFSETIIDSATAFRNILDLFRK